MKIDAGFCLPEKSKTYSFTGRIILRSLEGENLRDSQGFHNISLYQVSLTLKAIECTTLSC